jgi:hypothetical protein
MIDVSRLDALEVLTPDGDPVPLGTLWRDRPVVLALVRHFG